MKKIKRIAAGALAAVAVMTSALSFGTSAATYVDTGSWDFYINPNVSHTIEYYNMNYYNGGYRAKITSKTNGGATNEAIIYYGNTEIKTLTEVNKACNAFTVPVSIDKDGKYYATLKVQLEVEKGSTTTKTATNKGVIKVANLSI